jgi:hypothetical protein
MRRLPIWVRVAGIIALVLVGVLVSTMVWNAAGAGGHGSRDGNGGHRPQPAPASTHGVHTPSAPGGHH